MSTSPPTRAALLAVSLATACMFSPANETALRSTAARVEFRGVSLAPRAAIRIDAAAAPGGPFAQIATAQASGVPSVIGGAVLYEFSVSVAVPAARWAQTCAGSETFVRARGGNLVFTTYDSAALAGVSGEDCIDAAIADGLGFVSAASGCRSDYGAPVRLSAPQNPLSSSVLARDLRIVNPLQAEDYACLSAVTGDLAIADPSNSDLAFPELGSVGGDLEVRYPRAQGDVESRAVDLPELASVGGHLRLESLRPPGPNPGGPLAIDFGLPALTQIGGALEIEFEGAGAGFDSLAGLPALAAHAGDLILRNRFNLDTSYGALLPALAEVGGSAEIRLGLTCVGALRALESVAGDLSLEVGTIVDAPNDLAALAAIGGDAMLQIGVPTGGELPGLVSVGGSLALRYGSPLQAAPYLAQFGSVAAELGLSDSFAVPGEAPLLVGSLALDANPGLVDLAAQLAHVSVAPTGAISITDNPNISDCDAQDWADALPGHTGPVAISGNAAC